VVDLLDSRAVRKAVAGTRPDAVIHQATALAGLSEVKHFDRRFARTSQLAPRAPTRSWPPPARPASGASSPGATPAAATRARAGRSRPNTTRSTPAPVPAMRQSEAAMDYLDQAVTGC